jgi:hypothetical protein
MANERAQTVLVAAMAPMCVDRFQSTAGYESRLAALKEIKAAWQRRDYVAKGSWANFGKDSNAAVADALRRNAEQPLALRAPSATRLQHVLQVLARRGPQAVSAKARVRAGKSGKSSSTHEPGVQVGRRMFVASDLVRYGNG